jgi:hypothetical protein
MAEQKKKNNKNKDMDNSTKHFIDKEATSLVS